MPLEAVMTAPREIEFRDYDERPLQPNEVRLRTLRTGIKTGTELAFYRGTTPFRTHFFDGRDRLFKAKETESPLYPLVSGSWGVGEVVEVGADVTRYAVGDRAYSHWKNRPTHVLPEDQLYPLGNLTPESALLIDPALFGLACVHDAEVKYGDQVAVFGMGAIGLIAVRIAKLQGARTVIAVDILDNRLDAARRIGADATVNPNDGDAGIAVKELTGGRGADVAIEISGSTRALHDAIRCVQVGGLVVAGAYYQGDAVGLRLGEEWHHNRPTLKSSMAVWGCPHRSYPMWNEARMMETAHYLLENDSLPERVILDRPFPFEQTPDAFRLVDEQPEAVVKAFLTYEN